MAIGLIIIGIFVLTFLVTWGVGRGIGNRFGLPSSRQQEHQGGDMFADFVVEPPLARCPWCDHASHRHAQSSDDVVAEIERRVAADSRAVARIVCSPRKDAFDQLYMN